MVLFFIPVNILATDIYFEGVSGIKRIYIISFNNKNKKKSLAGAGAAPNCSSVEPCAISSIDKPNSNCFLCFFFPEVRVSAVC